MHIRILIIEKNISPDNVNKAFANITPSEEKLVLNSIRFGISFNWKRKTHSENACIYKKKNLI